MSRHALKSLKSFAQNWKILRDFQWNAEVWSVIWGAPVSLVGRDREWWRGPGTLNHIILCCVISYRFLHKNWNNIDTPATLLFYWWGLSVCETWMTLYIELIRLNMTNVTPRYIFSIINVCIAPKAFSKTNVHFPDRNVVP